MKYPITIKLKILIMFVALVSANTSVIDLIRNTKNDYYYGLENIIEKFKAEAVRVLTTVKRMKEDALYSSVTPQL